VTTFVSPKARHRPRGRTRQCDLPEAGKLRASWGRSALGLDLVSQVAKGVDVILTHIRNHHWGTKISHLTGCRRPFPVVEFRTGSHRHDRVQSTVDFENDDLHAVRKLFEQDIFDRDSAGCRRDLLAFPVDECDQAQSGPQARIAGVPPSNTADSRARSSWGG
jgi:hypothetical protein